MHTFDTITTIAAIIVYGGWSLAFLRGAVTGRIPKIDRVDCLWLMVTCLVAITAVTR